MLSNVTHSNFNFECNQERGSIDQLYIELGLLDFSCTHVLKLVSKFEINRITRKLIRAILRFRSSFLPPKCSQNNIQILFFEHLG